MDCHFMPTANGCCGALLAVLMALDSHQFLSRSMACTFSYFIAFAQVVLMWCSCASHMLKWWLKCSQCSCSQGARRGSPPGASLATGG